MEFVKLVKEVLSESNVAGGVDSAFGPAVVNTATEVSGDHLAQGDGRNVYGGSFPGMMTRGGMAGQRNRTKKAKRKKKTSYARRRKA